jgi:hypothetical protein
MPDRIRITVCVVALTQADYHDLDPALQATLAALPGFYDFGTPGKPYAASPDEWHPFDRGFSIREYLERANLEASLLSTQLYDDDAGPEVLKKAHLYIIDPLVLLHSKKRDRLAREIQIAIFVGEKAFCIILPTDLPKTLQKEIADLCAAQLRNLYGIRADNDSYEWRIEDADRLDVYLRRLARQLGSKPNPAALAVVQALLLNRGVPSPDLPGPPQLVS